MPRAEDTNTQTPPPNPFTAADVLSILRERNWLSVDPSPDHLAWCERAAFLLGSHAADRNALAALLGLVFHYDAHEILSQTETHAVLSRNAARDVLRELSLLLLDPAPLTADRFKEIVTVLKERFNFRSRDLFHPLRLVLTGRAGEGELDRVILLLDEAAALSFAVEVKSARTRVVEFCSALG